MATAYRYIGEHPRDYPTLGGRMQPGDVIYLDARPPSDGRFEEATADAPEAPTEPDDKPTAKPRRKTNPKGE